ncbi:ABC transporter permease subunit [Granulicatella sp. zg-ZJ]|nr:MULTISPECIES: methionine ABC transporter permease [unclassified Granulicatella]MBS4750906.1 ABC transporter permease [Carnobacteriaceae bacterium zg-ZUI78]NEW62786.1 ABC transporter permease subunit [Granulicatella sp. zg-ZJ]NEW65410.1 ABC transporter permease subunit [Granulicatella sp. zg-84]QMI86668.1 ABC transporter permease [Carnobacteriaceae bacterium zg-84]
MVGLSLIIAIVLGIPLGILLYITSQGLIWKNHVVRAISNMIINMIRSIPFIILMVALIPVTKLLVGKSTGAMGAVVPLSVAAVPLLARLVETALRNIDKGVLESSVASGASTWQIITSVLLPEATYGIIQGITLTLINIIAYSATVGAIGGGGIGDLAIRYGYYRYDNMTLIVTIVFLVLVVQIIQISGDKLAELTKK